ncbi:atrial natriuretic peptide receptor 2-like [Paramacrobiotus metropolitanus]|uniref:atrial natriuretic peptide receptor 2-like n=1 Tax=Paramacrobiotus metropolitanus TaxID=2943436 RepID=UPI002446304D|nr:atrial natriuretic peptide receptor 2-like [Paramacrobiotus metropolitanus]
MNALHASVIRSHGNLTALTCLIDSQLMLKITDYGLPNLTRTLNFFDAPFESQTERNFHELLWRAPELLRRRMEPAGTQKGDVYSFAILLQQIILRSAPFRLEGVPGSNEKAREIVLELKHGTAPPLRPPVPSSACGPRLYDLMEACWDENPLSRPSFPRIRSLLGRIVGHSGNIVDSLIKSMERYAMTLEQQVEDQMHNFMEEKQRSEMLLSNLLPKSIAEAMQTGHTIYPETFASTTVYFGDIPGFTDIISREPSPKHVIGVLNSMYNTFDSILEKFDVYKVETINDAYLVVSGLPVSNGLRHANEIVSMAMSMMRDTEKLNSFNATVRSAGNSPVFELRVGVNSGPCVAGVVGLKMPRYCLFGDTVNTAARMQTNGKAGKVHSTPTTMEILERANSGQYGFSSRGQIQIKGKGLMETFWIVEKQQ